MLTVRDLRAGYAGSEVLHAVGLEVRDSEAVAILGPNGHGKSTVLRAISGLVKASSGVIEFDGVDLTRMEPEEIVAAGVVHIPQGDLPFPQMTVTENLLVGAYRPTAWRERKERLDEVFGLFPQLAARRNQQARTLSGGERRMLALGRGMMAKAQLLLVDEPSLGLAPILVEQVYGMIRRIRNTGLSLLLVDENANHLEGLVDRVYLLEVGVVVAEGSVDQILRDAKLVSAYLG